MDDQRANVISRLTDEYGPGLNRLCRSLAYSREEAEDLFQDTLVKVLERPDRLENARQPDKFLYAVALRQWQTRQRKFARRRRAAPMEPLDDAMPEPSPGPEEDTIVREELARVRALADALPDKLRAPVALYYGMELSVAEIGALLHLPAGTIKSRLHRARAMIKEALRRDE